MHILASQRRSAACAMVASLSQAANALSFGDSSRLSGKLNSPLRLIYIWNSAAFSLIRRTISWTWHASRKQFQHLLGVKHAHRHACGCRPGLCASSVQASNLWVSQVGTAKLAEHVIFVMSKHLSIPNPPWFLPPWLRWCGILSICGILEYRATQTLSVLETDRDVRSLCFLQHSSVGKIKG